MPGLCCSGPDHWQSRWEELPWACARIELPDWDDPDPLAWVAAIDDAIAATAGPVVLAAHSLGCHAVVQWALSHPFAAQDRIIGALLVAPPDVDSEDADPRVARFAPSCAHALPFPAFLVASRDDGYARFDRSEKMARSWGASLIDLGKAGHINADSELGAWDEGQGLIARLSSRLASP